jgi:CubicO group peptidase (beta-lactamase class C family)
MARPSALPSPPPEAITRGALVRGGATLGGAAVATAWAAGRRVAAAPASPGGAGGGPEIPDTAAGRRLARWLAAFNAGDVEAMPAFHRTVASEELAVARATFDLMTRRAGGPAGVYRVLEAAEDRLVALLYAPLNEQWLRIEVGGPMGAGLWPAPPPPEAMTGDPLGDEAIGRELERYLGRLVAADAFSGAVAVARDGVPFFTAAYGLADRAAGEPNRVGTRFNLGSMNKMLTAVAVAQLAQQGRLAVTDTLARVLPEYPNRAGAEQITVHQLLTHTSGLGDFFGPRYLEAKDRLRTPRDYFPLFADAPLAFAPGTGWGYSNAGYVVLGAVVERVSGQEYFDYVRAHVYEPAGMTRSDSFERDAAVPDLAIGYTVLPAAAGDLRPEMAFGPRAENTPSLGVKGSPAGGGYSTVEDLLAFDRALRGHRLLSPELTDLVLTGKVGTGLGPEAVRYAYGFEEAALDGVRIVGHGGGGPGISANLDLFLDRGVTAVVLTNYDGAVPTASAAAPVAQKIRRLVVRG